ncbi:MAG TPA: BTAD domain-containing putative transcriptional regulator [Acidimicrobiales bacterium]
MGSVRAERAGAAVPVTGRRRRALLAALAVRAGRWVPVADLVDAVWGDDPPAGARTTLQTYVSRLRGLLGEDAIAHSPAGYRLGGRATTDAERARELAAAAARARAGDPERAADLAAEALGLWDGTALAELADDPWFRPAAVSLADLHAELLDAAADALLAAGRPAQAVPLLEDAVRADSLREPSQVLLVRALHAAGRGTDAMRAAERYRRRLRDETGLLPGPALGDVEQQILAGEAAPGTAVAIGTEAGTMVAPATEGAAAPGSAVARRHLPRPTPLVGRDGDVRRLAALVEGSRLVTVTGPGGVGKTRLAAELLAQPSVTAGRRVVVVELAPVAHEDVAATVGASLGYRAGPADPALIAELLGSGDALLVLDNCEHVTAPVRDLVRAVLGASATTRLVLTSRTRLGLPDEQVLALQPLPTTGDRPPSVELFVERLGRADPSSPVSADDPAVRDLCARLDGLPLALELAAGRAAVLGVDALGGGGPEDLDLLAVPGDGGDGEARPDDRDEPADHGRGRGGAARHTSLRAVVEWSYDLLSPPARLLLAALSVFDGEFDLPAAEAVGAAVLDEPVALLLSRLVDASLVAPAGGPGRFRLLELIRQFGEQQLERVGRAPAARRAHARWVADRLAEVEGLSVGPAEAGTAARLDGLRHDLRSALRWAGESGEAALAAAIAGAVAGPLLYRPDAMLVTTIRAVAAQPGVTGAPGEAALLGAAARAAFLAGDLDAVDELAGRAVAAAPAGAASTPVRHRAAHALGVVHLYRGRPADAERWFGKVDDDPAAAAVDRLDALGGLAVARCYRNALDASQDAVDRLRALAGAIDSETYGAFADYAQGEIDLARGDVEEATARLSRAADRAWAAGATFVWGIASTVLAGVLVRHRPLGEARTHLPALIDRWRATATWPQLWTTLRLVAELLATHGREEVAALVLAAAERDPAAPELAGDDRARHDALRARLADRLGAAAADGIAAGAAALDRVDVLERATRALAALPGG